jgi:exonuclease SbcD
VPPAEAVDGLNDFLEQLTMELHIPVIMISGNHDSAKRLGFGAKHMRQAGLHILSNIAEVTKSITIDSDTGPVNFYGIPYHDPVEVRETFACEVKTYDQAHSYLVDQINAVRPIDIPAVLISHCFIDGAEESESERPLSIGGADRVSYEPLKDFDYVALGHLHAPQYKGVEYIRYSGSLLKYSFSEYKQQKGITLVEMDQKGLVSHQHLALEPQHDLRVLEGTLADILESAKTDSHADDYLLIKLTDKHDILDPMGQLRQVYPNTLQLERSQYSLASGSRLKADVSLKRSESDVFNDFFQQVTGNELSEAQQALLLETIQQVKNSNEGKA